MNGELRTRKNIRLKNYDYRQPGYYFVTICTQVRYENILCEIVPSISLQSATRVHPGLVGGAALGAPLFQFPSTPQINLTTAGQIVEKYIQNANLVYENRVKLDCYVIMPDHIHLIVQLCPLENGSPRAATPTIALPNVINTIKALSTKKIGYSIWQRGYHEHIIRNNADLNATREYIQNNPMKWVLDRTEANGQEEHAK